MALMTFEQLDRSIAADSDSDDELAEQQHLYRSTSPRPEILPGTDVRATVATEKAKAGTPDVSGLSINPPQQPPRPGSKPSSTSPTGAGPHRPPRPPVQPPPEEEEEDDDDPFSDKNVVETPAIEKGQPRW